MREVDSWSRQKLKLKLGDENKTGDAAVDLDTAKKTQSENPWSPNQRQQNNTEGGLFGGSEESGPTGFGESDPKGGADPSVLPNRAGGLVRRGACLRLLCCPNILEDSPLVLKLTA